MTQKKPERYDVMNDYTHLQLHEARIKDATRLHHSAGAPGARRRRRLSRALTRLTRSGRGSARAHPAAGHRNPVSAR
jgi:hypothetical protein